MDFVLHKFLLIMIISPPWISKDSLKCSGLFYPLISMFKVRPFNNEYQQALDIFRNDVSSRNDIPGNKTKDDVVDYMK